MDYNHEDVDIILNHLDSIINNQTINREKKCFSPSMIDIQEAVDKVSLYIKQLKTYQTEEKLGVDLSVDTLNECEITKNNSQIISSDFFKSIIESLSDSIMVLDSSMKEIVYSNHSGKKMLFDSDEPTKKCSETAVLIQHLKRSVLQKGLNNYFELGYSFNNKLVDISVYRLEIDYMSVYVVQLVNGMYDKQYQDYIEKIIYKDELTGLYNRRYFMMKLNELLRTKKMFTLCMVDIDELKYANDHFGHDSGDKYLTIVAEEVVNGVRCTDVVCRYGGDEIMIIFHRFSKEMVLQKMEFINENIQSKSEQFPMSISYGVVESTNDATCVQLLSDVDKMMYINKMRKNYE